MEDDHQRALQGRWLVQRLHGDVHALHATRHHQPQAPHLHRRVLRQGLPQCIGHRFAQALAHHGVEVPVGLAGRWLEVLSGAAADVDDVARGVDHDRRRRMDLQQHVVGGGLQRIAALRCVR